MGVSVVFEGGSDAIEVVPGAAAECVVLVKNTGMVVDRVQIDVLGEAAGWVQVEPAQVNLMPGAIERVHVRFEPPRLASVRAGDVPFALRAQSSADPEGSIIQEGLVQVAEFADLGVELVPRNSTGRRSARFTLVVENLGNRPEPIRVESFDPDEKLGFKAKPGVFVAQPGTATFVRLRTIPNKTFLKGPNRTLPFQVSALPEQGEAATDQGVMLEKQVLPEWLLPVIGIAAIACALLFALWFFALRPVVNSSATAQANAARAQAQALQAANAANIAAKAANAKSGALTALSVKIAAPAVLMGGTDLASASGTAANGVSSNPTVVWTSSDPNVATVSPKGVVTAVNPGTVTITATNATAAGASASSTPTPPPPPVTDTTTPTTSGPNPAGPPVVSGSTTVNVVGPLAISTAALPQAVLGKTYTESLTGTGGTGANEWSVVSGTLPPGFTLSPEGILSGTATAVGTSTFKVQLVNAGPPYQLITKSFTLPVIDAPAVETSSLPGGTRATLYSQTLTAVFGTAPYTWALVPGQGILPPGMTLNSTTGVISGNPTTTGVFTFTVQVTDSAAQHQSSTQQLSIAIANPLSITTAATLPQEGVKNSPYSLTLGALGGTQPYTWSVVSGNLPLGLTLNPSSGAISGTPTVSGTSMFTVQVVSTGPPAQTATEAVSLTVVDAPVVATSSLPGATTGTKYESSQPAPALAGSAGTAPYTWALVPGQGQLPDGLTLDPSSGAITGTPTTPGTSAFTVELTDSTNPHQTATQHLSIAVANPLSITTAATLPQDGVVNAPYSLALNASGGTLPYTWSVVPGTQSTRAGVKNGLPAGLTLNSATGVLSGTPTESGTFTFSAKLVDSGLPARSLTQIFTINTVVAPVVATSSLPGATTGTKYESFQPAPTLAGSGGTGPYTWALVPGQGQLPDGLALDPNSGAITGTPTTPGTSAFTVQLTDSTNPHQTATQHLSIAVADPISISTLSLPDGVVNGSYSRALSASGGTQPYRWSIGSGALPAGLTLDPATGVISGTPTAAVNAATFTVTVTDSGQPLHRTASQPLSLTVVPGLVGTNTSLPTAAVGQANGYSAQLTARGGTAPYVFTLTGTLPPGLSLSPAGLITGVPTQTGAFPFSVQITDASSPPLTVTEPLTITVVGSLQITTQSLPAVQAGVQYSQTLTATGGTAPYTWSVKNGTLPTGLSLDPVTGTISGTTVATAAPATITFAVADTGPPPQTASRALTIGVSSPLTFSLQLPAAVVVGQNVALTPTPSGGSGTYQWLESGALPAGLTFTASTGVISGTVTANPGTYPFQLTLGDQTGGLPPQTEKFTLTVVAPLSAPGSFNLTGTFGSAFKQAIQPTGGVTPYSYAFTATDVVPSWMSLDSATGVVSGTPDVQCTNTTDTPSAGTDQFACASATYAEKVTVKDSIGETFPVTVNLVVSAPPMVVNHVATVTQTVGAPLDFSVGSVHGGYGSGALTFTATGLPCSSANVCDQIDPSTGMVTGTLPDFTSTSFTVTVTVTQDDPVPGSSNTYVGTYTITINTAAAATPVGPTTGPHS